jgi:hypothetical protein
MNFVIAIVLNSQNLFTLQHTTLHGSLPSAPAQGSAQIGIENEHSGVQHEVRKAGTSYGLFASLGDDFNTPHFCDSPWHCSALDISRETGSVEHAEPAMSAETLMNGLR